MVRSISKHICWSCLSFLRQTATQRKKLDEINNKLLLKYQGKARQKGFTIKLKLSAKRLEFEYEDCPTSAPEQLHLLSKQGFAIFSSSPILPIQPIATSTLHRIISTCPCITEPQPQEVSHKTDKSETVVKVTVVWNSKTSARVLPDNLNSVGKLSCRGTYTQIARAVWRNSKIREQLISFFLKEIYKECCNMCSSKNPGLLRKTAKKDIVNFSFTTLDEEVKQRTPFYRVY